MFFFITSSMTYLLTSNLSEGRIYYGNNKDDYSYYLLAVQKWCSNDYKIHGLWPQFNHSSYPSYCEKVKYVEPKGDLLAQLNQDWSSCGDDSQLWKHEWQKHGSCVEQQQELGENGYFNLALKLFNENLNRLSHCKNRDCTLGCFDLNGNLIKCP